jgi:hypothetical protein
VHACSEIERSPINQATIVRGQVKYPVGFYPKGGGGVGTDSVVWVGTLNTAGGRTETSKGQVARLAVVYSQALYQDVDWRSGMCDLAVAELPPSSAKEVRPNHITRWPPAVRSATNCEATSQLALCEQGQQG